MKTLKTKLATTWTVATYDVWGNAKDGYDVNDVYRQPEIELSIPVTLCNEGTVHEFKSAYPSLAQIRAVFGVRCHMELSGDDITIYVNRSRDGYPIGELSCISHKSLSPIRESATISA